jgi:ATP-dependent helicase/nuclease subunit B
MISHFHRKKTKKCGRILPKYGNKLLSEMPPLREKCRMQARFLLGPAGSGKTFRCLGEIRAALCEQPGGPPAALEQGESGPLILLVPKQATFQLERQLLAGPEISGYTRLQILSFERLARFALEQLGVAPPPLLAEEGRVMVLRSLLMRHESELKLFGRSARRPGFAREISALLAELNQHQFTPARLRALARRENLRRELRAKLADLALLSEEYSRWLAEHKLQDANRLLDMATEALRKNFSLQPSAFSLSGLWLDGFAEMTPQELDLLAAVMPFCTRATLAFCLDERSAGGPPASHSADETPAPRPNSQLSIWSAIVKTYSQCRRRIENIPGCKIEVELLSRGPAKNRFAGNSELASLEKNWSLRPQNDSALRTPHSAISITACPGAGAEAAFAAREILKFVRAGNRFRDCAVLVRDLENYHQPLARAFHRCEIPFFLDRREAVAHHPLAELTRGTLRTVAFDWRHDDWFAALKAGFSTQPERGRPARGNPGFAGEPPALLTETEIDRLENAALESGWRGKKWLEPLPDDSLERLRKKILPPFENFAAQLARFQSQPTGAQLADALRELWNELRVEDTLEAWSAAEANQSAIGNRQSAIHSTVFDQMNAWLDNLALAFPREPLPLRDWLPIVGAGLAGLTVGVIPPVLDEVLIGAVDRARNPDLKFTLVLGVNETVFPAAPPTPAILTRDDRDELESRNAALGPDLFDQISRERYLGYIACTRASEKLSLTFSRQNADGQTLNPSPFIAHLRQVFSGLEIEEFAENPDWRDAEHANELMPLLAKFLERRAPARRVGVHALECSEDKLKLELQPKPAGTVPGAPPGWECLFQIPALKSLAEKLAALREPDGKENLSPALAEKLFGPVLQTSVSRLEEFAQCPFRFFVHSGLRADERKIFELDARERGSFQHEVLKQFHEQFVAEKKRWRDVTPAEARERIYAVAAALTQNFNGGLLCETAESRFAARAMTESLQDFIGITVAWMRGQNEFDPVAAELDFGGKESPQTAWEINLADEFKLALRGRIDRVDLCRSSRTATDEAAAIVIDYKSSHKKLDAILVEHGVQLQLLAYLNVLRHWKNPREIFGAGRLTPAGVFYVNLRGQFVSGGTREEILDDTEAAKLAYRHSGRFDAGVLDKLDRAGVADQFNYRLNQDGSLRKGSVEALPRAEFEKLLDRVEAQLREFGDAIYSGETSVNPYRRGKQTPCEFCDYASACRIDPWTHPYRVLRPAKENIE